MECNKNIAKLLLWIIVKRVSIRWNHYLLNEYSNERNMRRVQMGNILIWDIRDRVLDNSKIYFEVFEKNSLLKLHILADKTNRKFVVYSRSIKSKFCSRPITMEFSLFEYFLCHTSNETVFFTAKQTLHKTQLNRRWRKYKQNLLIDNEFKRTAK